MNTTEIDHLRDLLLERYEELVVSTKQHHRDLDDSVILEGCDLADQANTAIEQELTTSISYNEDHLLKRIETALSKMDEGTYGICDHCGENIPQERLEAKPEVSLCISCQSRHEKISPPQKFSTPDFLRWPAPTTSMFMTEMAWAE